MNCAWPDCPHEAIAQVGRVWWPAGYEILPGHALDADASGTMYVCAEHEPLAAEMAAMSRG